LAAPLTGAAFFFGPYSGLCNRRFRSSVLFSAVILRSWQWENGNPCPYPLVKTSD